MIDLPCLPVFLFKPLHNPGSPTAEPGAKAPAVRVRLARYRSGRFLTRTALRIAGA
jgi:hypothetical protein